MTAKEDLNYRNSVLIVWDMQNGIAKRAFNLKEIAKNARLLIDGAHEHQIPVVYSQHTALPYEYLSKYAAYSLKRRGIDPKNSSTFMAEGTEDWKILDELAPTKDDLVLRKHTASFFIGTILEQILRSRNIETLILCGVSTEGGIEGTARHGAYLGFIPVIAQDAVGSFDQQVHERMLEIMRRMFEVRATEAIIKNITESNRNTNLHD
jgi:nicotinamidase-related amidase